MLLGYVHIQNHKATGKKELPPVPCQYITYQFGAGSRLLLSLNDEPSVEQNESPPHLGKRASLFPPASPLLIWSLPVVDPHR